MQIAVDSTSRKGLLLQQWIVSHLLNSYWAAQAIEIRPLCIISVQNSKDVSTAVRTLTFSNVANRFQCPFAIRSGGNAIYGYSNLQSGIVIDVSAINSISISEDKKTTSVGPGAKWEEVYFKLDAIGFGCPWRSGCWSGSRWPVTGRYLLPAHQSIISWLNYIGGMAYFSPRVGFVCDNIVNYEIVLSSGEIISANEGENPDLLIALRGGGNNFGIITRVDIRTFE